MLLNITEGKPVSYKNQIYRIKSAVNLIKVLLVNKYGETIVTPITDLKPSEECIVIGASNFMFF